MISNKIIFEFSIWPTGGRICKIYLINHSRPRRFSFRHFEVTDDQIIKVDMCVGAVKALDIEANFSTRIRGVIDLVDEIVIDVKEEVGSLGIDAQNIIHIQVMNATFCTFFQNLKPGRRTLEKIPFLGTLRNGEG